VFVRRHRRFYRTAPICCASSKVVSAWLWVYVWARAWVWLWAWAYGCECMCGRGRMARVWAYGCGCVCSVRLLLLLLLAPVRDLPSASQCSSWCAWCTSRSRVTRLRCTTLVCVAALLRVVVVRVASPRRCSIAPAVQHRTGSTTRVCRTLRLVYHPQEPSWMHSRTPYLFYPPTYACKHLQTSMTASTAICRDNLQHRMAIQVFASITATVRSNSLRQ
jgi:hypothetical protein